MVEDDLVLNQIGMVEGDLVLNQIGMAWLLVSTKPSSPTFES